MKSFINELDKKVIKRYCDMKVRCGDQIRVKALAVLLDEKYCLYDIVNFIKNELKVPSECIWRGDIADYIITLPRGHVQITGNDLYYPNKYYHQYVVSKELGIDIGDMENYIIHHIDQDKGNNAIENLFVFYDTSSHIAFHQALKHNADLDIRQFNEEYIDNVVNEKNADSIKRYLQRLDTLMNVGYNELKHKKNKLSELSHTDNL